MVKGSGKTTTTLRAGKVPKHFVGSTLRSFATGIFKAWSDSGKKRKKKKKKKKKKIEAETVNDGAYPAETCFPLGFSIGRWKRVDKFWDNSAYVAYSRW